MPGITDYLGYDFKPLPEGLSPQELMSFYRAELERGKSEGFTPVIIPLEDNLEDYLEELEDINEASKDLPDAEAFFAKRKEEYSDVDPDIGEMTEGDKNDAMVSMFDYETGEAGECVIVYLPTDEPWRVPFFINFGGWNECPLCGDMAAVLRHWYLKYGAVPAAVTHDTLELVLPSPVPRDEAMDTAMEHYLFCPDRIDQCTKTGTVGELAGDLSVSTVWYFWWD